MADKDLLQRFIFAKAPVRGEFIHLQESFQTIVSQHQYTGPVRQLLGEALCVAGLLSATIKFKGRLTVQFRGKGKLKLLLAQCNNDFQLRGLVKWEGDEASSYEELMEAFNQGVLVIMLDAGVGKRSYQGMVAWRGNSLVASIEGYFQESEQLLTKIWLAVNETQAAGFLLQMLPGPDREARGIEKDIIHSHWEHITHLTAGLKVNDLFNLNYQLLLQQLYPEEEIRIFHALPVRFQCSCSRQRGEDAILLLGQEEAEAELKKNNHIVVTCDFCNKGYVFNPSDIAKLFQTKLNPPPDISLH